MPKRAMTGEDTAVITGGYQTAMRDYASNMGAISISNLLMSYDGNKGELARALADATGTKYASQMKNISRWLNYENGDRGPQARDFNKSKASQSRVKDLYIERNPPTNMSISITGWIGYDNDYRHRTVDIDSTMYNVSVAAFMSAMQSGNTSGAYREVFAGYAPALSVASADSVTISFS
jgi:hypothetical protein